MKGQAKPVERLFPFAAKAGILVFGQDALGRHRKRLHFILVTTDLSANSREKITIGFPEIPLFDRYTIADTEKFFHAGNTKVIGFRKSELSQSIFKELKALVKLEEKSREMPEAAPEGGVTENPS